MADKPRNGTPRWMSSLVLVFIVYAGYLHFKSPKNEQSVPPGREASSVVAAPQADTVTTVQRTSPISGDIAGSGDAASCGQTATLEITGTKSDGSTLEGTSGPATLSVGTSPKNTPWAADVSGMKKGGVREVTLAAAQAFPSDYASHGLAKDDRVRYRIEMKDLTPSIVPGSLPFRASDLIVGRTATARCGDKVKIHLDVWKDDGTLAFSTKQGGGAPFEITIGAAQQFYGLDRGTVNMLTGSVRALTLPPAYLAVAPGASPDPRIASLPHDKVLLADVQLIEIESARK